MPKTKGIAYGIYIKIACKGLTNSQIHFFEKKLYPIVLQHLWKAHAKKSLLLKTIKT